jgi:hypothetical protein
LFGGLEIEKEKATQFGNVVSREEEYTQLSNKPGLNPQLCHFLAAELWQVAQLFYTSVSWAVKYR